MYALLQTRGRAGKVYHTAHGAHLHTHRLLLELFKAALKGLARGFSAEDDRTAFVAPRRRSQAAKQAAAFYSW